MSNLDKLVITLEMEVKRRMSGTTSICFSGDFELLEGWIVTSVLPREGLEPVTYQMCQVPSGWQKYERPDRVLLFCILGCVFLYSAPERIYFLFSLHPQEVMSFNFSVHRQVYSSPPKDDIGISAVLMK